MKLLLKIAVSLLGLAIAGIVVFVIFLDAIIGKGIESVCSKALGVETSVGSVRVGLVTRTFSVGDLEIANPPGFETDHFFSLDRLHFELPRESLREQTIVVRLLEIDGVDVSLETADEKTNYDVILDNLDRFSKTGSADPSAKKSTGEGGGGGVELAIRESVIRDIDARIDLGKVEGASDRIEIEIPEIRLKPNENTGAAEVSIPELTRVVVTAVLVGIAKKAPAGFAKRLLSGADGLKSVTLEIPGALSEAGVDATAQKLGEGAADAVKKLGGLFGADDDEK